MRLISLEEFEAGDHGLLQAKQNRTLIEYYFTCTPSLPLFIFRAAPEVNRVTYLDADLFFFSDVDPVFDEIGDRSIAIIGHRFPGHLRHLEEAGSFNVGWVSFKRDEHALACLQWWRERCIEWCYDKIEAGRFADQKYLDDWPERFENVIVLQHKGANLAPWNLANYTIAKKGDRVWVDEQPLVFFHFHGFKSVTSWLYNHNLSAYKTKASRKLLRCIFEPYIEALDQIARQILPVMPWVPPVTTIRQPAQTRPNQRKSFWQERIRKSLRWWRYLCIQIITRKHFIVIHGRVV